MANGPGFQAYYGVATLKSSDVGLLSQADGFDTEQASKPYVGEQLGTAEPEALTRNRTSPALGLGLGRVSILGTSSVLRTFRDHAVERTQAMTPAMPRRSQVLTNVLLAIDPFWVSVDTKSPGRISKASGGGNSGDTGWAVGNNYRSFMLVAHGMSGCTPSSLISA